jgi:serine phosphatase RsbU (regulator of sigma subunit)
MPEKLTTKILCVDDEDNILAMYRRSLGREYTLYTANSPLDALDLIKEHKDFAVIVSDYSMPTINGVEFLKLARDLAPDSVQIMLTGNIELDIAIQTINEINVYRYLSKPFPMDELRKVLASAINQYQLVIDKHMLSEELKRKNIELVASNEALAKQKKLLEYELELAKTVYSKVHAYGHSEPDGLDYINHNKETAGGDFLLTHTNLSQQSFYIMMGDLTGHGLSAALAVLLVTEIFDTLCIANPSIEMLVGDINEKMCRKLPLELFCAAFLIRLDWRVGKLSIWQGGMPDAYLLDAQGNLVKKIVSNNLPLGVLAEQNYLGTAIHISVDEATSLFVYSDGLIEQSNQQNIMFGDENLLAMLRTTLSNQRRVDMVLQSLKVHQQEQAQLDDVSMIELNFSRVSKALNALSV